MWLRNFILLLAVLMAGCDSGKLPSPFHANDVTGKYTQADFQLIDQYGKARTLADFHGKVSVLFFGYTQCPDVCPTTLTNMKQTMNSLGKNAANVQVLFVTLDPERDKPSMLAEYVAVFDPTFLALSGDSAATAQIAKAFNVTYKKNPTTSGYSMDHSDGVFIIDLKGKVRLLAPYPHRSDWIAEDIRLLLAGV